MKIKTNLNNLENYKVYLQVMEACHEYFKGKGYLHMDLPVLSTALIPESYLEIFETEFNFFKKRQKLYLTPSPELFLKRLLVEGIGDCYYLGRAFRNSEPNSNWHLPEFTMLEFYKVGVNYLEFADEVLEMLKYITTKCHSGKRSASRIVVKDNDSGQVLRQAQDIAGMTITFQNKVISFEKWEKMSVTQAFEKYSGVSEKELFDHRLFFKKAKDKGYNIGSVIPAKAVIQSRQIDSRLRGNDKGGSGNDRESPFTYEDIFTQIFAQEIEPNLGKNGFPTLLYDYPKELASLAKMNKNGKTAQRCEFYINGLEVGGFCTELNDYQEQEKRFVAEAEKRKKLGLINHEIDKGFIDALKYGLPDCTGAGIGFERLAMIFANVKSVSELRLINIE